MTTVELDPWRCTNKRCNELCTSDALECWNCGSLRPKESETSSAGDSPEVNSLTKFLKKLARFVEVRIIGPSFVALLGLVVVGLLFFGCRYGCRGGCGGSRIQCEAYWQWLGNIPLALLVVMLLGMFIGFPINHSFDKPDRKR